MLYQEARTEYEQARRNAIREKDRMTSLEKDCHPKVLEQVVNELSELPCVDLGILDIPSDRIVGTKTAGRITAFSPSFYPLMDTDSEFARKWMSLCVAHMGEEGIREPIVCYEYYGEFYVQEGNKRVSVLRHFQALAIPAHVIRVMPAPSDGIRYRVYTEFLEFYALSQTYCVRFRKSRDYEKLQALLGVKPNQRWTEDERRIFHARLNYFREAFQSVDTGDADILPEEALLLWLELFPYEHLSSLSSSELRKTVSTMWSDIVSQSEDTVRVETKVSESKPGILSRLITPPPDQLRVAFVNRFTTSKSGWTLGHNRGSEYLTQVMGDRVEVKNYMGADSPELTEQAIERAVEEGAQIVFTTVPQMGKETLKAALQYPKIRFFNCSLDQPYTSISTYYGRIYEAKFITGAIAGAMARNDRIGYIASYPIYGVPAAINAFALGAQMTNPRAKIELRWSCLPGSPQADFFADGIRVISNRDVPTGMGNYLEFCNYGTYLMDETGKLSPLGSPVWGWGKFYESIIRGILSGSMKRTDEGINYWLGMDGGYIDVELSEKLPHGVRVMADLLKKAIQNGTLDPFSRRIIAQDGSVKNEGNGSFQSDELIHMDWLCENVSGSIPGFSELLPRSRGTVQELGLRREELPMQKGAYSGEDTVHI